MAVSSGVFSSFFAAQPASFVKASPGAVVMRAPAKLPLRALSITAASKQATETEAETKKREPRGIMKPRRVSPEMQAFLGGVAEIPRTQALKEIWAYIKAQNLQVYLFGLSRYYFSIFSNSVNQTLSYLLVFGIDVDVDVDVDRVECSRIVSTLFLCVCFIVILRYVFVANLHIICILE